jgi:ABC-type multidrug transport system fused ATPase/permease subunit
MVISTFLVNTCIQSALLLYGCYLVENENLAVEVLIAFMLYQGQLQEYTLQIFQSYTALLKSSGAGDKVFEFMDRVIQAPGVGSSSSLSKIAVETGHNDDDDDNNDARGAAAPPASLQFKNVSFTYPTRGGLVLSNLNLTIPRGKICALVGASGSGKSTIVSLIERLYDVEGGEILFNGGGLKEMPIQAMRRTFGIVAQDPALFSGSILSVRFVIEF